MRLDATDVRYAVPSPTSADKARLSVGDVLFTRYSGTRDFVGACAVVGAEGAGLLHPDKLIRVEVNPDIVTPEYLVAAASSPAGRQWLEGVIKTTAGQTGIAGSDLKRFPVLLAPLAEQERIVAAIEEAFSKLDAGEAGLRTVHQLLKRMRDAVLAAAVTGRLVPQDPTDTPAAKVLADLGVEPLAPHSNELPASWEWVQLGALLSSPLANGRSVRSHEGGFPVLRLTSLRDGRIDLNERKDGEWEASDAAPYLVERGDFLVSRGNGSLDLVGRGGLVDVDPDPVAYPDTLIRVRAAPELVAPLFLAKVWNSRVVRDQLEGQARTTAGIYKVNQSMLSSVRLPLPPIEEQRRIVTEAERQFSFLDASERTVNAVLARAAALRRSVLKVALEGRLVPQDPNDEPASVLLEQIGAERAVAPKPARRSRTTA